MPMREECKHFQSRSYATGEVVRFCELDLAPEAPWRCPDDCSSYAPRMADVGWQPRQPGRAGHRGRARSPGAPTWCACSRRRPTSSTPSCPRPWPRWRSRSAAQATAGGGGESGDRARGVVHLGVVRRPGQRPLNSGARFSMKAVMASTRSSEPREAGVPGGHVVEALGHGLVLAGGQHRLGPLHGQGRVGGDLGGELAGRGQGGLGVGQHVVHEADLLGPRRGDVLAGEGQLGHVPLADDAGQPLQAPEVGHDGHLGLAHREHGVGTRHPDVAGRDDVDATPDAVAVDGGDDRLRALGHRAVTEACMRRTPRRAVTARDAMDGGGCRPVAAGRHRPRPRPPGEHARHGLEVEADAEVRPACRQDDGAHGAVRGELVHGPGQVGPERRAHGVAGLGPVEPQRGDVAVAFDGEDLESGHGGHITAPVASDRRRLGHCPARLAPGRG